MPTRPLTPEQLREALAAQEKAGSAAGGARLLGISERAMRNRLKQAANPDYPTRIQTGTSTLYDAEGNVKLQWVKEQPDHRADLVREVIDELSGTIRRVKPVSAPKHTEEALCNLYTLTDCHVGMKAWEPETGADWDLEIAEQTLTSALDYLIKASPKAHTGVINQLGDWLHFDSLAALTPTSGHLLDADSRFPKVVRVATRILRYIIDAALKKHEHVVVLMAEGNHDMASSVWLRHIFSLLYENEPRVHVIDSEMPYYVHQHGKTMLAFHHGHLKKNDQLPLLFAAQFPEMWGQTKRRYCHTGHRHHTEEKEHSGMTVIQHPTIAARDAYASRGGWIADRQITSITYHKEYGQVARNTVVPDMLS